MKIQYILIALPLYYSPAIFAGGADVFSNTEGKIITLFREGPHRTKYYNKKQNQQNKNKHVIKTNIAKDIAKNVIVKPN